MSAWKNFDKLMDICPNVAWKTLSFTYKNLRFPGCSSAWPERLLWEQEVAGSNPVTPIFVSIEYISIYSPVAIYFNPPIWALCNLLVTETPGIQFQNQLLLFNLQWDSNNVFFVQCSIFFFSCENLPAGPPAVNRTAKRVTNAPKRT